MASNGAANLRPWARRLYRTRAGRIVLLVVVLCAAWAVHLIAGLYQGLRLAWFNCVHDWREVRRLAAAPPSEEPGRSTLTEGEP